MLHTPHLWFAVLFATLLLPLPLRAADDDVKTAEEKTSDAVESKSKESSSDESQLDDKKSDDAKTDDTKTDDAKSDDKKTGDKKTDDKNADEKKTEASKAKSETSKAAPATVKAKEDFFKVEVSLDGVFESKGNTEVSIHPETWSDFVVETAAPQGEKVKKGDTLIQFDTTKIDEQIRDMEAGRKLAELSLEQLTQEIRLLEQSMPLNLQLAERSAKLAEVDLQHFVSEDRELMQRRADFTVKLYKNNLEYQKEELKQLEKMYLADDLTEETEEIILKRTRDQVEQYEFMNELAKIERDQLMKISLPRREDSLKESVNRTALTLQKARTTLPIGLDKARLELERQKFEREKNVERLAQLKHDRELMKVTAPADGIVYYGQCVRGQWSTAASAAAKLRQGGHVSSDEIVMTIVNPANLFVRATVPEKDLWQLRRGMTGSVQPAGYGETKLPGSIDELNTVPNPENKYLATVLIDTARLPSDLPPLAPGMTCKVKVTTYSKDDAITLPAKVVQTDKKDEDEKYVWLPGDDGKPVRRDVTVGRRTAETVEITKGLEAGDKVLREPPKEDE